MREEAVNLQPNHTILYPNAIRFFFSHRPIMVTVLYGPVNPEGQNCPLAHPANDRFWAIV